MKPYYEDNHIKIYNKDCRDMSELPDNSVQMVVTSPPYWGLRKYSGEQDLIWGGDKDCQHKWGDDIPRAGYRSNDSNPGELQSIATQNRNIGHSNACSLCGAWRGAYGLEPMPEMYVQHTIEILREIRRVLRKDGVVFWNIGDSYVGGKGQSGVKSQEYQDGRVAKGLSLNRVQQTGGPGETRTLDDLKTLRESNLKPKDLCLIPFRVAIAAQKDGWWVRSIIIWSKPNPMPESVTDRPTESHEYILMLTKSARYYWDQEAVREQSICTSFGSDQQDTSITHGIGGGNSGINEAKRRAREAGTFGGRNLRSVWEFPTQPYPEAHFAVFPEKLPEQCIKAATPEVGCCAECGAPWERVVDTNYRNDTTKSGRPAKGNNRPESIGQTKTFASGERTRRIDTTLGWQPTCKCKADKAPSIVLDPFAGAGTTLLVAKKLNRHAVGHDLSMEYCDLALKRNMQQVMV